MANTGHGHVVPRDDGVKARCGGPAICAVCQREAASIVSQKPEVSDTSIVHVPVGDVTASTNRWRLVALNGGVAEFVADEAGGWVSAVDHLRAIVELDALRAEIARLRVALSFYANRGHFELAEADAWDTVSGEPQNLWCDEAGTATVEDGSIARAALAASQEAGND